MNLIERLVELMGPPGQPGAKPSAPERERGAPRTDLIERALGAFDSLPEPARDSGFAAAEPAREAPPESPPTRTTRQLSFDPARLRYQGYITNEGQRTAIDESFRRIKRRILANVAGAAPGAAANLVQVTSALPGEGKTFCAINLAISIALEMDRTVLLVDADVARPAIPRVFGIEIDKGLMDVLSGGAGLADVLCKTDIEKLLLLPAGTPHRRATELLGSDAMHALLREMASRYRDRIIVFDSPPLLGPSEAAVLAGQMGQIVVVVEAGKTTESALLEAIGQIDSSRVAGVVLNKGERTGSATGYDGYG